MTTEAKTERPLMPIRPPDSITLVTEGARPVGRPYKPPPSLREIQKELADLKGHLERIIGQVKTLSDSLHEALDG